MITEAFMKDLAEVLEVGIGDLKDQFELSNDVWDSLTIVSTIALIDEHFEIVVDGGDLADCSSIKALIEKIETSING